MFKIKINSIMSSNSVRCFGGPKKRFAAKYRPKPKPRSPDSVSPLSMMSAQPGPIPDAPDKDN